MRGLSQYSFMKSFVLIILLFEGLNAAKALPIELSHAVVNTVVQAAVPVQSVQGNFTVNVLSLLLMVSHDNPNVFQLILNIYNSYKPGKIGDTIIHTDVLSNVPTDIQSIIFTKHGKNFILNSTIFSVLSLLKQSIVKGVDMLKSKTFKEYWRNFFGKIGPTFLVMTAELVRHILAKILEAAIASVATKTPFIDPLCILIHDDMLQFEELKFNL